MRRPTLLAILFAGVFALATPISARADVPSDGATVSRDVIVTMPYTNPCTGATGIVTVKFMEVLNVVGSDTIPTFHVNVTRVGDFTLVEPGMVSTGHFVTFGNFEGGPTGVVSSVNTGEAHGTTADGSTISVHFVSFLRGTATEVKLSFEHCA